MKQVNFLNKEENNKDIIAGRNPVSEALKSGRSIDTLYVAKGELTGSVKVIAALAKEKHIPVKEVDRKKLDFMTNRANHQGIVALAAVKDYSSVDDIFELARQRDESPFVIVLDGIEDPHNLGAIIRTAECAGAHGVIIPSRRAAASCPPRRRIRRSPAAGSMAPIWTARPTAKRSSTVRRHWSSVLRAGGSDGLLGKNAM